MPILSDPNSTFDVVLERDKDKLPTPTFVARCQSMRGQLKICSVIDLLTVPDTDTAVLFTKTIEALQEVFVGWKNMPTEYSPEALIDCVNYSEARELLRSVLYGSQLGPEEKKD